MKIINLKKNKVMKIIDECKSLKLIKIMKLVQMKKNKRK